jgi:hypothetical protein
MTTPIRLSALLIFILMMSGLSKAQPARDECAYGAEQWSSRNYAAAYDALKRCRDTDYGRSFETDFMLGTSACRIPERRARGAAFLNWVQYTYADQLTDDGLNQVSEAARVCSSENQDLRPSLPELRQIVTAGGRYTGKTYYWLDRDIAKDLKTHVSTRALPPPGGWTRRMIKRGDTEGARRIAKEAAPQQSSHVFSKFVIVSQSSHTSRQIEQINDLLERYLAFFVENYGVKPSENYIFVYLLPSIESLAKFASSYHGMNLHFGVIAYSFRSDLSITAVIPRDTYGSLFHELFHLVARSNFGDIPPWLDEGIAALYEVSQASGNGFRGLPNWRGAVLARYTDSIPTVADLIDAPDRQLVDGLRQLGALDDAEKIEREAVYAAACRYFALYLQETGKLFDTYRAVREYSNSEQFAGTANEVADRVVMATGLPMDGLNEQFKVWLESQLRTRPRGPADARLDKFIPTRP